MGDYRFYLDRVLTKKKSGVQIPTDYILAYDFATDFSDKSPNLNHGIAGGDARIETVIDNLGKTYNALALGNSLGTSGGGIVATTNNLDLSATEKVTIFYKIKKTGTWTTEKIIYEHSTNFNTQLGFVTTLHGLNAGDSAGNTTQNDRASSYNILNANDASKINYFSDQNWHSVCEVKDKSIGTNLYQSMYYDGVLMNTVLRESPFDRVNTGNYYSRVMYIGARFGLVVPFWGAIAKFKVYDRVLTQEEITALHNEI